MIQTSDLLIILSLSAILVLAFTKVFISLTYRFNWFMDKPNQRSSHSKAIPRCGGVPIFVAFLCLAPLFANLGDQKVIGYLIGGVLIAIIGLADDLFSLNAKQKLIGTIFVSVLPILFGIKFGYQHDFIGDPHVLSLVTFLWIFGMINAFNFMDGIDGLIGGISVIASVFVFSIAVMSGAYFEAIASLLLLGASAGFLFFNFSPASVFLGDLGSMFLWYNFAVLSIMVSGSSDRPFMLYAFGLIFAVVIYDSMATFFKRVFERKRFTQAHREHLYQRLVIMGYTHRQVSMLYYLFGIFSGVLALVFVAHSVPVKLSVLILVVLSLIAFSFTVKRLEILKESVNVKIR